MTAAERAVRAECPKATIELRERAGLDVGWIHVVMYDGVEYAGSGSTAAKAWDDAASNLGVEVPDEVAPVATPSSVIRASIAMYCEQLEPDSLRIVELIAARAVMGQRQYGKLDLATSKRDWQREMLEELADSCFYGAAHLLSETGGGK